MIHTVLFHPKQYWTYAVIWLWSLHEIIFQIIKLGKDKILTLLYISFCKTINNRAIKVCKTKKYTLTAMCSTNLHTLSLEQCKSYDICLPLNLNYALYFLVDHNLYLFSSSFIRRWKRSKSITLLLFSRDKGDSFWSTHPRYLHTCHQNQ